MRIDEQIRADHLAGRVRWFWRNDFNRAVGIDFDVESKVLVEAQAGCDLHEFLRAFTSGCRKAWRIHSSRRAMESSSFSLLTCARKTARSLNWRSNSAFSPINRFSSFSRNALSLPRRRVFSGCRRSCLPGCRWRFSDRRLFIERLLLVSNSAIFASRWPFLRAPL